MEYQTKVRFLTTALSGEVVGTALRIALLVGTILALINHGESLIEGTLSQSNYLQIALTYLVPYCVSTYSSAKVISNQRDKPI